MKPLSTKNVLVITTDRAFALSLQRHIEAAHRGVQVLLANNLMTAYNQAEAAAPVFAFVEDGFTNLPEFEMMMALFSAVDTRWVSVMDDHAAVPARRSSPLLDRGAGIFELSKSDPPRQFVQYLDMMINAPRRSAPATQAPQPTSQARSSWGDKIILIGSSTGGVEALREVLSAFPVDCPPTVIVQHTGKSFGLGLVSLLDKNCPASVMVAKDSRAMEPGAVHVAAGQPRHLGLSPKKPHRTRLKDGPPVSGHTPSVDALFQSAVPFASNVVATILTGMGQDGARGLLELRKAGATTFAQDEQSSVVYGMPRVAWEMGAAQKQVPIKRMAATLLQACRA